MNENLKDILSNLHSEVDQETLLKYLEGHLSAEAQYEVEKNLLDDAFEADAVEGLQTMQNAAVISSVVEQLNRDLRKKTKRKNRWRMRREAKLESWLLMTIVFLLLLVIVAFFVIHRMGK